jgi:hypothetical protein
MEATVTTYPVVPDNLLTHGRLAITRTLLRDPWTDHSPLYPGTANSLLDLSSGTRWRVCRTCRAGETHVADK